MYSRSSQPNTPDQFDSSPDLDAAHLLLTLRVPPAPESVLVRVTRPKDVIPRSLGRQDPDHAQGGESDRVESQVTGLQGVGKGDPGEVANGEHEAKSVGRDVHRGQHRGL